MCPQLAKTDWTKNKQYMRHCFYCALSSRRMLPSENVTRAELAIKASEERTHTREHQGNVCFAATYTATCERVLAPARDFYYFNEIISSFICVSID